MSKLLLKFLSDRFWALWLDLGPATTEIELVTTDSHGMTRVFCERQSYVCREFHTRVYEEEPYEMM